MSFSSRLRTTSLGAVLLVLALAASACGGSKADATDKPTSKASVSASVTPTPTPTPTASPSAEPLSPFEDKAPVKAARAWAAAASKAVNDRDRSLAAVVPLTTAQGFAMTRDYFTKDDMVHGYVLPGPAPFTPVSVQVRGNVAKLSACLQNKGWSTDRKTGKKVNQRKVSPVVFEMRKVAGSWKFNSYYAGTADCGGVRVQGVRW
ncbi:MAG TPA: hypothetical protein VHO29_16040 [Marmoricola sp.]|nr:hypothetical protein [Marmoricola sp.]